MSISRVALAMFAFLMACGGKKVLRVDVELDGLPEAGEFPHELWTAVLQERVDAQGLVDYKGIQEDRGPVDLYLAHLAQASPDSHPELFPDEDHELAYWINAYNAFAITGVVERPGLISVDDVKIEFFATQKYIMGGEARTLYGLENNIVRPRYNDARTHFALNCDSGGCPRLPQTAFMPDTLQEELDIYTTEFIKHPDKCRLAEDGAVEVNQIFDWYAKDFEAEGGVLTFLNKHGGGFPEGAEVRIIPYDWTLIAQPGRAP